MVGKFTITCSLVTLALALAAAAPADVLYQQSPLLCDNTAVGILPSDTSMEFAPGSFQVMDDFVLQTPATLDEVQWWGAGGSPGADNFTVRLFTGSFESPTLLAEFNAGSAGGGGSTGYSLPLPGSELDVWAYNFQLQDPVALDGGTPYYLSVVNNTPGSTDWGWMMGTNGNGRFGTMTSDTGQWQEQPVADAGFQLSGTVVPEPATITLLVIGIAGYLVRRRRYGTGA